MSFLILPDEIIDLICAYLDLQSKVNLYDTCRRARRLLSSPKYLETFKLTFLRTTISVLRHGFFTDNKTLLRKLDLSGIDYVPRGALKQSILKFKNLVDLNVGYTQILMPDCRDICKNLPELRTICANFKWPKEFIRLHESDLHIFRLAFSHLDCLHFIGSSHVVIESDILLHMVDQERLRELMVTAIDAGSDFVIAAEDVPTKFPFKKVTLIVKERIEYPYVPLNTERMKLLCNINFREWEMLLIKFSHYVYSEIVMSKNLLSLLHPEGNPSSVFLQTPTGVTDDYKIVMWLKETYTKQFLNKVKSYCESALPTVVTAKNVNSVASISNSKTSYFVCSCAAVSRNPEMIESPAKVQRVSRVITNFIDTDQIFPNTGKVECLTLAKMKCACTGGSPPGPIQIFGDFNVFRSLKFVCLTESAWYDPHFFIQLFSTCPKLETLNIQTDKLNFIDITKYLKLSKSLRHFRLCQKTLDINNAFQGIGTCPSLQIVVLFDTSPIFSNLPLTRHSITDMVKKCKNLLYVALMSSISEAATKQQKKMFKECLRNREGCIFRNTPGSTNVPRNPYEQVFSDPDYLFPENVS